MNEASYETFKRRTEQRVKKSAGSEWRTELTYREYVSQGNAKALERKIIILCS